MGSFCPAVGRPYLHGPFNFAGSLVETVSRSLCLSCASTGQASAGIRPLTCWHRPKFLLNSRLGHFSAPPSRLGGQHLHRQGGLFSRSYETNLPSSLTKGRPLTLVYSTSPPVSVCGTGAARLARGFSWQPGISPIGSPCGDPLHHLSVNAHTDLPMRAPYQLGGPHGPGTYPPASPLRS